MRKSGKEVSRASYKFPACYSSWFIMVLRYRTRKVTSRRRLILPLCMVMLVLTCYVPPQHLQFVNETGKLEKTKKTLEKNESRTGENFMFVNAGCV